MNTGILSSNIITLDAHNTLFLIVLRSVTLFYNCHQSSTSLDSSSLGTCGIKCLICLNLYHFIYYQSLLLQIDLFIIAFSSSNRIRATIHHITLHLQLLISLMYEIQRTHPLSQYEWPLVVLILLLIFSNKYQSQFFNIIVNISWPQ